MIEMKKSTRNYYSSFVKGMFLMFASMQTLEAQITLKNDCTLNNPASIGVFQGINFKEGGFSALYPVFGTDGKEFWTISDRGVNIDAANANTVSCRPTYDKIYAFPSYVPKIHRIRIEGNTIKVLQTITMKRPNGTGASGIINPTGLGSTTLEVASTDTVLNCANFAVKTTPKDVWGIDSEGLAVDEDGNFWICEEGGPTIWKLNKNGVVIKRYTPYANLPNPEIEDVAIDTIFKFRKNNRGFEGLTITPNGKIYAIIQSPLLNPTKSIGEGTRIHRILEIDPTTDQSKMFVYVNEGPVGMGANEIRFRDWKIGDMTAINNAELLVIEQGLRGNTDRKYVFKIDIRNATPVTSDLYSGVSLEALVDVNGLIANNIVPVQKTLFMDLLANNWPSELEKAEGLAIINDSTIAFVNDNDFGQYSPAENGLAVETGILSHVFVYGLSGANKLSNYVQATTNYVYGKTGPSTGSTPYLQPLVKDAKFTSILSAGDAVGSYTMAGIPDGLGAFDNGDNTFTLLMNHEFGPTVGVARAHGQKGAFVSKWIINKNDLSVASGSDLIQNVKLWNGTGYTNYNAANPSILTAFGRFCAADLPVTSAFYNSATGLGTQTKIFMTGEENGDEGRAFANIVSGTEAGTTYELPRLGKYSYENAVACPSSGDKTVVIGLDDSSPGQVYVYVGTKTNSGTEIDKAGLTNGALYGIKVNGMTAESSLSVPSANTAFTLESLGNTEAMTGATLSANSITAGVTEFLRPEDGAWDPSNVQDFYFATTNSITSPSRLWKLHFTDVNNPLLGGEITAVLDGTEGQKMLDNLTIDNAGHILLLEDVGNNVHIGKTWEYNTQTDALTLLAAHDESRFIIGGANYLSTQDEEASGIIDVQEILGSGMFILVDQAHYTISGQVVQGGQILALYNPSTADSLSAITSNPNSQTVCENSSVQFNIAAEHASVYQWQVFNGTAYENIQDGAIYSGVTSNSLDISNANLALNGKMYRCLASRLTGLKVASDVSTLTITPKTIPTFATVDPICNGETAPILVNSSVNSIPGTWSPATVDNQTTATYTFTPTMGECATESTLEIVVNQKITPSFATIEAICQDAMLPVLLETSTNSISGTWSPETINNQETTTYTFTPNAEECAISTTVEVVVNEKTYSTTQLSVCSIDLPLNWNGSNYFYQGTFTKSLIGENGCDSIATLELEINQFNNEIEYNLGMLSSLQPNATYQWINCANNQAIAGATQKNYTPADNGNYAVIVTKGDCSDTTECFSIQDASLAQQSNSILNVSIYPNPTEANAFLKINSDQNQEIKLQVNDAAGRQVMVEKTITTEIGENIFSIPSNEWTNGIYFITMKGLNNTKTIRLVVKN
jgi:hypothetical protein